MLTEDIDQVSFAIGRRRPSGGTPVAAVSRAVLQGWMADLSAAGLEPLAIYPDISLMPETRLRRYYGWRRSGSPCGAPARCRSPSSSRR